MSTETFGEMVARRRREEGWTQAELAEKAGLPLRTLQGVELGTSAKPQRKTRLAIAQVLSIEGDPKEERAEWPEDVQLILDIVGAHLMTLSPSGRLKWLRDVSISR